MQQAIKKEAAEEHSLLSLGVPQTQAPKQKTKRWKDELSDQFNGPKWQLQSSGKRDSPLRRPSGPQLHFFSFFFFPFPLH
jgi:hypothetical protein